MNITTIGIDLAKLIFQVHGIDARGKVMLRKQLRRSQVACFSRSWRRASLGWRRAVVRISGRVS
jgi:transposase